MSNLKRLKKLPGSKDTSKKPTQSDFEKLIIELQANRIAQKESMESTADALKQLSQIVLSASKEGFDVSKIIDAIGELKNTMLAKVAMAPIDYKIDFERDRNLLMKTGIKLTAVPNRKLN